MIAVMLSLMSKTLIAFHSGNPKELTGSLGAWERGDLLEHLAPGKELRRREATPPAGRLWQGGPGLALSCLKGVSVAELLGCCLQVPNHNGNLDEGSHAQGYLFLAQLCQKG